MIVNTRRGEPICLGYETENDVEAVVFDKTAWIEAYGPGTFEFVHKRRQDSEALPVAVDVSGGVVTWTITAADVAYRGAGEAQLRYYNAAGQIKASEIYRTQVSRSLVSNPDVPSPFEGWVAEVLAAAAGIQNMQAEAETLVPGSAAAVTKTVDPDTGVVTLTFGIPEGLKGETGRGVASMSVLSTGEWRVVYTDGTSETVGYDVYSALDALKAAAQEAAETASDKATEAASSARNAEQDADRAEQGAKDAQAAKTDAQQAKTDAETAKTDAEAAARNAKQDVDRAEQGAEDAQAAKTDALAAKTAAESARDRAETAAQTLVLDSTLTSPTQAAQAEAVGDAVDDLNESLNHYLVSKYTTIEPSNWLNLNAITDGELLANGTVTESTTRFYTDFIPVNEGDQIKAFRGNNFGTLYRRHVCLYDENKSVLSGGTDSTTNAAFTIPSGVSFVRVTLDKNILTLKPMIVRDGITPTAYSAYFEPYEVLTEDFLSEESEEAVEKIKNKTLTTADLKNHYACALPYQSILRMTVGIPEMWYSANCITPSGFIDVGAGSEYAKEANKGTVFPNETAVNSVNGFSWHMYDDLLVLIASETGTAGVGRARRIVAENLQNCSVLVIGDSTVAFGTMTQYMLDYFNNKEKTLTLLGTLGSGTNRNEGRSGWSAKDYLTDRKYQGVTNPFYNPSTETFDFEYYMQNQGYTAPDFVVLQLGINDLYNYGASAIEPTWDAIKTMIDSIFSYNDSIHILLNLPTAPNSDRSQHSVFLPLYQNRIIRYNEYASIQAGEVYGATKVRPTYCHLILDPDTDIRDNVHPTNAGFEKMAKEVISQINVWQNGF